jgi:HD-GYP domain-containing protein (c-di-GMP phosphodiesterase class II)
MAHQLEYSFETQRAVRISGLLHDIGKIAVPDSILRKPGRLNDDEASVLQQHPVFGALIVKDVPNLADVLGGIRHHHERFDGTGYPDALKGEEIPLLGRLLAVPIASRP